MTSIQETPLALLSALSDSAQRSFVLVARDEAVDPFRPGPIELLTARTAYAMGYRQAAGRVVAMVNAETMTTTDDCLAVVSALDRKAVMALIEAKPGSADGHRLVGYRDSLAVLRDALQPEHSAVFSGPLTETLQSSDDG